ncbi:hypothetical protein BE21_10140 [Sorangium cellulosum]|uniref:Secreted protein n=1 Tax=Sorangium cellulosum TaxID=56 RepID=A0A150U1P4_SORCE|nr:hypothetical protein BE21_10140 [Sorangium cellulosum]
MKITVTKLWALALSMAFVCAPAACFDSHVDPIVNVHLATSVAGATEGPWAACVVSPEDEGSFSLPHVCPDPGPDGEERRCSVAYVAERQEDGSMWCDVAAVCLYECETAADCPQPQSGTATPVCNSYCSLPCDENTTCPNGMECWHLHHGPGLVDEQGFCMWKYQCD